MVFEERRMAKINITFIKIFGKLGGETGAVVVSWV
jgi:hypothetical protein